MYQVSSFVFDTGERYCLMVCKENALPVYYPNLYLTTQFRNRSVSSSTLNAEAAHLAGFYTFCKKKKIDLEGRLKSQECLSLQEIDCLRDFCQENHAKVKPSSLAINVSRFLKRNDGVCLGTQYARLTSVANYLNWLPFVLLKRPSEEFQLDLKRMVDQVRARRPKSKNRNPKDRSIDDDKIEALLEVVRLGSDLNPFESKVQNRNRIIIILLLYLGIRRGELLNIRIQDIDFNNNQLAIVRRADERDDVRTQSPNAKTQSRRLPLTDLIIKDIHCYITKDRRNVPGARKHDYLIVTHKEGANSGMPLSISGYQKILSELRHQFPKLSEVTGHMLRHTWNRKFSEKLDGMIDSPSPEKQEQIRSYLMGWKPGSGTAGTYNRRFIEQASHNASLAMQDTAGLKLPKGLEDD